VQELKRVCKEFRIGALQEVEDLLGGGYVNANLKIRTSKGKFVFRIFLKDVEKERLQYAYSIVSKLSKEGVPALLPLLNTGGLSYTRYKEFVVQITPFVEAAPFKWLPSQAYNSGKMLCRMHRTLFAVEESPTSTGIYQYYQLAPLSIRERLKEEGHILPSHEGSTIDDFYRILNKHVIETSILPKTIIHGDWNPWNQLFKENHEVHCFMDFDTLQRGERVFDVAYALYFFLIQQRNEEVARTFLKGYGCLTDQEINVLPFLIARIGMYFGILVEHGDFQFARNLDQLKWVISEQGRNTVQGFCIRDS
jgi:Ser/Thr protein kinase RdoA (MazF antagonist)